MSQRTAQKEPSRSRAGSEERICEATWPGAPHTSSPALCVPDTLGCACCVQGWPPTAAIHSILLFVSLSGWGMSLAPHTELLKCQLGTEVTAGLGVPEPVCTHATSLPAPVPPPCSCPTSLSAPPILTELRAGPALLGVPQPQNGVGGTRRLGRSPALELLSPLLPLLLWVLAPRARARLQLCAGLSHPCRRCWWPGLSHASTVGCPCVPLCCCHWP